MMLLKMFERFSEQIICLNTDPLLSFLPQTHTDRYPNTDIRHILCGKFAVKNQNQITDIS
ncbi:MAG: hypothetical protein BWK80_48050 [Desulfobacteraceae bacterium IS3]|nr:MAG: hypothetical protein BWK80_48050 [Desulfobacteraceae bacterium IS3]